MTFYRGAAAPLTDADVTRAAVELGCDPAAVRAVMEVEAAGKGFYADGRLTMLPERHVLWNQLADMPNRRAELAKQSLVYPRWGTLPYPASVNARYELFHRMADAAGEEKAARSTSWGLPQMMGFNYALCGYVSAIAMVKDFAQGEGVQLLAMGAFIRSNRAMHIALVKADWPTFARHYNGPGYRQNRYDDKLAAAFAKHNGGVHADRMLRMGDKGDDVRAMQVKLDALGFELGNPDGHFGRLTEQALREFQRSRRLVADGKYGDKSRKALEAA